MAAGDITYDTTPVTVMGNTYVLNGSIEVDDTNRTYALLSTKSRILHCSLIDEDGSGAMECRINSNAAGTATMGSIAVNGNHATVNTVRFRAHYR